MTAPYNPPVKGQDFQVRIGLEALGNPGSFRGSPTIAAGDFKVSVDGGALTDLATTPSVSPAGSALVLLTISAAEMAGDVVTVVGVDQTAPKEWSDFILSIPTVSAT